MVNLHLLEQIYREGRTYLAASNLRKARKNITYLARELAVADGLHALETTQEDIPEAEQQHILATVLDTIRKRMDEISTAARQTGTYTGAVEKLVVRTLGFWHGPGEPPLPHPADLVDPHWDSVERELVIRHLREGWIVSWCMGSSSCRLCGKPDNGSTELSDGYYLWPEGLPHYLEAHQVRLPREFVDHCRQYPESPTTLPFRQERMKAHYYHLDHTWWAQWR